MFDYAKEADVKAGDVLVTDGGFTCMKDKELKTVCEDENGLYITCAEGHHYLDGQLERKEYIGLRKTM